MRIGLRKISEQFFRIEIDIFAEQPHVVGAAQDSVEQPSGLLPLSDDEERAYEPERADREGRCGHTEIVLAVVAIH